MVVRLYVGAGLTAKGHSGDTWCNGTISLLDCSGVHTTSCIYQNLIDVYTKVDESHLMQILPQLN